MHTINASDDWRIIDEDFDAIEPWELPDVCPDEGEE
jgi:hypothetical protein